MLKQQILSINRPYLKKIQKNHLYHWAVRKSLKTMCQCSAQGQRPGSALSSFLEPQRITLQMKKLWPRNLKEVHFCHQPLPPTHFLKMPNLHPWAAWSKALFTLYGCVCMIHSKMIKAKHYLLLVLYICYVLMLWHSSCLLSSDSLEHICYCGMSNTPALLLEREPKPVTFKTSVSVGHNRLNSRHTKLSFTKLVIYTVYRIFAKFFPHSFFTLMLNFHIQH